jgi:CPA2 family monovalent cation:H+ antiporter-2
MPHHTPLIGTIVVALVVAFLLGAVAHRLRVSPIAGYLLAGVIVGPFTPGFVADTNLASELAEIGVILLMFGVGLHFSLRDLLSVRNIAVPGAVAQIAVATAMGMGLAGVLGWGLLAGFVFGLALSVASTVVLLRALESRNLLHTDRGRIAVGWLIVEDLATVLALVLLPALAMTVAGSDGAGASLPVALGATVLKIVGFVALMLLIGRRIIPWALHWVVHTGSRELFRLAVLAIALGVAFGAALIFDVSFALGAFFAGMILGETQLSRRAGEETLPLRDAFAVLFFVSVGMLFDPAVVLEQPLLLAATVAIIVFGKSLAAYAIVRAFGYDNRTAITISASLAQIGEFSFILANLGTDLAILPAEGRDLILAGAIVSILLHPFIFGMAAKRVRREIATEAEALPEMPQHIIVVGYGRVGKFISARLRDAGREFVLIDDQFDVVQLAAEAGLQTVRGNAASREILMEAGIDRASHLLIAIPEGFEAGGIAESARRLKPDVSIVARAHSREEVQHLQAHGADRVVMGEEEIARQMVLAASA